MSTTPIPKGYLDLDDFATTGSAEELIEWCRCENSALTASATILLSFAKSNTRVRSKFKVTTNNNKCELKGKNNTASQVGKMNIIKSEWVPVITPNKHYGYHQMHLVRWNNPNEKMKSKTHGGEFWVMAGLYNYGGDGGNKPLLQAPKQMISSNTLE